MRVGGVVRRDRPDRLGPKIERGDRRAGVGGGDQAGHQGGQNADQAAGTVEVLLPLRRGQLRDLDFAAARRRVDEGVVAKVDADVRIR